MPAPSINQAITLASRLYKPTKFRLHIPKLPNVIANKSTLFGTASQIDTELQFATESIFFPSRNISSEPYKTAGPVDEIPYESTYSGDLDIAMRVSADFKERMFFETWMDSTVNRVTQEFYYPDQYRCNVFISALVDNDKEMFRIRLSEVWPKSIGRVSVGQGLTDTIAVMQVQLSFRRYFVELPVTGDPQFPRESLPPGKQEWIDTHQRSADEWWLNQVAPITVDEDGTEWFEA